jgi:hypothetical protein
MHHAVRTLLLADMIKSTVHKPILVKKGKAQASPIKFSKSQPATRSQFCQEGASVYGLKQ